MTANISIHALLAESDYILPLLCTSYSKFLSTLSLRRATARPPATAPIAVYFYPRSPCGERPTTICNIYAASYFYPRSPCGERPVCRLPFPLVFTISIHALLAESDMLTLSGVSMDCQFLSTLSLRRATSSTGSSVNLSSDFYPRSPCGERLSANNQYICKSGISIHALLAESDSVNLSSGKSITISIHALLAESDLAKIKTLRKVKNFYPRSPCGERRRFGAVQHPQIDISIHALLAESDQGQHGQHSCCRNFYPRSPCGERLTSREIMLSSW